MRKRLCARTKSKKTRWRPSCCGWRWKSI